MEIKTVLGGVNTPEDVVLAHVRASIRRGYPQVRPYQPQGTPLALVAGGPSVLSTEDELRDDVFRGCQIATVNGAYQWCIDHNFKPSLAIMLDARPENAEMLRTPVPGCQYVLASQCAPQTFDIVAGRAVRIFHAMSYAESEARELTAYYGANRYAPVTGGSTVTIRALSLLRMLGFLRMDLYGFDSCWLGPVHHAYPQALNDGDHRIDVTVHIDGQPDRRFVCAPWHLKQWEDFQLWVKERGQLCDLHVHGDGMIAYMMRTGARLSRDGDHDGSRRRQRENPGVPDASDSGRPADAHALIGQD